MIKNRDYTMWGYTPTMPTRLDNYPPAPQLMTQDELVRFLRISEISVSFRQGCMK